MTTQTFARIKSNPNMAKMAKFIEDLLQAGATLDQVAVTNLNSSASKELIVIPKEKVLHSLTQFWMQTSFFTAVSLKKAVAYATQGRVAYEQTDRVKERLPEDIRERVLRAQAIV